MRNWISLPRIEGKVSRQAHVALPEGTYERELGREGFFGPATHMYHRHPPTGWSDWEGPLKPRAFDTTLLNGTHGSPWDADPLLFNAHVKLRVLRTESAMTALVRNGDGDDVLFLHEGAAELFCDYGHLSLRDGDYLVIPRGTMWRLEPTAPVVALLIECTGGAYQLPEKGLVGGHAIFDPAVLDVPSLDDAFLDQQSDDPWQVLIKRRDAISTVTFPFNPLDVVGWKGDTAPVRLNWRDIRPLMSHRYHVPPSAHTTAPVRERPRSPQGALLPQQRRLRRGDLLSPGRVLQPRQHSSRHDHPASLRLSPRAAPQSLRRERQGGANGDRRGRGEYRHPGRARHQPRRRSDRVAGLRPLVAAGRGVALG